MRVLISALLLVALTGCTHVRSTQDVSLSGEGTWLVLPLTNRTATPQAGLRAAAIVESVLSRHGVQTVDAYPDSDNDGVLFEASSPGSRDKMTQWVSTRNGNYVVSGVVHEWRYKTGVDGEPAVGVMLEIRELPSGNIVYSGTGSRAGWARDSLSETGQKVIDKLLKPVID
ncbi:hypothetical protein [Alcanivorax sp. DP30]|uniref:hypothetical protein n=1 Tax=Alcanivorax sp. DP30 TaxID=2606217 RepID=UPI001368473E|nr:hypothetical protein [Alcanivorax sp. DP30]MZR64115.1 hypothetical protein [Alcanivorax sp. DP30]